MDLGFKIIHLDGEQKLPDDDIYYILAKDGLYLKKKLGLIESLTPVKQISILESATPYAKMNIGKIPGKDFAKVISFFKQVYEKFHSEAIVLLYYNEKNKRYKLHVPFQKVSSAGLEYVNALTFKGFTLIGDIHSHSGFSAFHSGVDDKDEEHFDGLHITIGDNNKEMPSITASIVVNGVRFTVDPIDYVYDLELVEYSNYSPQMFRPSFIEIDGVKEYNSVVKSHLGYYVDVPDSEKECDPNWIEMIEDLRPSYIYRGESGQTTFNWHEHFSPKSAGHGSVVVDKKEKKKNPCDSCIFKNYKSSGNEVVNEVLNIPSETSLDNEIDGDDLRLLDPFYWIG